MEKVFLLILIPFGLLSSCRQNSNADLESTNLELLKKAAKKWEYAVDNKDANMIASMFSKDAVAMYPFPLPTYGRDENKKVWQRVQDDPDWDHPISVEEVVMANSGELAYIFGRWGSRKRSNNEFHGGRYLTIWRLIDDQWQIVKLSANVHEDINETTMQVSD
jgi:ketosteroid isomerase-like protein